MSAAVGRTASVAAGASTPIATVVATANRAASFTAAVTVSPTPRVVVSAAGVTVATTGVTVATTGVSVALAGVPIASPIAAVATPGVAVATVVVTVSATEVAIATAVVAVPIAAIESTPASVEAVSTTAIVAVVPRASADKDAADKVVRTVKAIRRAFVGIGIIVDIRANGSYADIAVARAYSNANGNLSLGVACGKHENAK